MKIYKRILGIIILIFIILFFILLAYLKFTDEIQWWVFFLLLIPCYVILHFLILNKIGFSDETFANHRFYIVSSVISILILIAIPLTIFVLDYHEKKIAYKMENEKIARIAELKESLKEPKDLGKDTTVYNIVCSLKTRLIGDNLEYIFTAKYLKKERPEIKNFHVELKEKDGFLIRKFIIEDKTRNFDAGTKTLGGYSKNGSIIWSDYKTYEIITSFNVGVIPE